MSNGVSWKIVVILAGALLISSSILGFVSLAASAPTVTFRNSDGVPSLILWRGRHWEISKREDSQDQTEQCDHVWSSSTDTGDGFKPAAGAACLECGAVKQ